MGWMLYKYFCTAKSGEKLAEMSQNALIQKKPLCHANGVIAVESHSIMIDMFPSAESC